MINVLAIILAGTATVAVLACLGGFIYAVLVRDDGDQAYAMFWITFVVLIASAIAYAGAFAAVMS